MTAVSHCVPKRMRRETVLVACLLCLAFLSQNMSLVFYLKRSMTEYQEASIKALPSHEQQQQQQQQQRPRQMTGRMMPVENINSTEYGVFDNVCLHADGHLAWKLHVRSRRAVTATKTDKGLQPKQLDNDDMIKVSVFVGEGGFIHHTFRLVQDDDLNVTESPLPLNRQGTHMLMSHHTPDNNFHLTNDLLLPVFRAHLKTRINGLLFFEGCVRCWENKLPTMSLVFDMMNLTVTHPVEHVITAGTPMCFERLILRRYSEAPFYSREGRFSSFWPQDIFTSYRDNVHAHVRALHPPDQEMAVQPSPEEAGTESQVETSWNASRPVLSWISRSSSHCKHRCISNEKDFVVELSQFFIVHVLDFEAGVTAEEAIAFIMNSDVLIGLHGAGLGYISYLPDRAMVVELKSKAHNVKKLFLNMASSINIPYYAVTLHCFDQAGTDVYTLPSDIVRSLSKEIADAHYQENISFSQGLNVSSGQCLFPREIHPCGRLSSTDDSRCYLEQQSPKAPWRQCVHYHECE